MWTLWDLRWTRRFDQHAGKADPRRLSLNATTKAFEDNQKVIDSIMEQWCNVSNMESSKQQGEAMKEYAEDMGKIMMVFRRLANGDIVPRTDEKKLMEYDDKMYQIVYLTEHGLKDIYIQTWSGNERMIALAKKLGFVEFKRKGGIRIVNEEKYDAITYIYKQDS